MTDELSDCPVCCGAQYGRNEDRCYRVEGHDGPHWNKWGTTWADE